MNEEKVWFKSGSLSLEGFYQSGAGTGGALITHPHSQMGGSMHNNVVEAMVAAFQGRGYATLRFNFRGVGRSEGRFDNGIGEQEDVRGARSFLEEKGIGDIILSGYSFGAWVNSRVLSGGAVFADCIMVSPPIEYVPFDLATLSGKCGLIICGDRDQFCPLDVLRNEAPRAGGLLSVVDGADHFYFGREQDIIRYLDEYLAADNSIQGR